MTRRKSEVRVKEAKAVDTAWLAWRAAKKGAVGAHLAVKAAEEAKSIADEAANAAWLAWEAAVDMRKVWRSTRPPKHLNQTEAHEEAKATEGSVPEMNQCAKIEISVFEIISDASAWSDASGQKVFDRISVAVAAGHSVEVSFRNITTLTSTFLDAAIGQMYGCFTEEQIAMVTFPDISIDDAVLLNRVVENAKAYFINRWEVAK